MKNLMMIHLESLNYLNYMTMSSLFPQINKVKEKGFFFENYFSSATSTLMVLGDIFYGGMEQYESCSSLDAVPENYFYQSSLFDDLKKKGYTTGLFIYPDGADRESAQQRHIAGFDNEMLLCADYNDFNEHIDSLTLHEPFAVSVCNYISNMAINGYTDPLQVLNGTQRWEQGFRELDRCIGDMIDLLKKRNVLNRTIVVLYGDHGDDFWGHGTHRGLTHAIEPYAHLIHVPLIILDETLGAGSSQVLVSAIDLKKWIWDSLFQERERIFLNHNYVIARSAYAAQPVRAESFNKSYSITDGKLLLLVSCAGLEYYDIRMDPQCTCNYLQFFQYDSGKIKYDKNGNDLVYHFGRFMNELEIRMLRQNFYFLKEKLYQETLRLYQTAGWSEHNMNEEMNFECFKDNFRDY